MRHRNDALKKNSNSIFTASEHNQKPTSLDLMYASRSEIMQARPSKETISEEPDSAKIPLMDKDDKSRDSSAQVKMGSDVDMSILELVDAHMF